MRARARDDVIDGFIFWFLFYPLRQFCELPPQRLAKSRLRRLLACTPPAGGAFPQGRLQNDVVSATRWLRREGAETLPYSKTIKAKL